MSNHHKNRKRNQEPLYYRPSKAARQPDNEWNNYSLSETTVYFERYNPGDMGSKKHKYKIKYNSDFDYDNDYDYDYVSDESYYDQAKKKKNNRRYYYSTEENSFQKNPYYTEKYESSETETLTEDDSYSDYSHRGVLRKRRESANTYEGQDPRWRKYYRVLRKGETRYPSDTERSYYDSGSYVVWRPSAHRVYKTKRQRSRSLQQSYDDTVSNTYTNEDSDLSISKSQAENQVYMAKPMSGNTPFSRERLLSVIDYDESPKQKPKGNEDIKGDSSELLYIPVIFKDGKTHSNHEMTLPKLTLNNHKKGGQEQNNIEVFVATNLEQGNVFDHTRNKPTAQYKRKTLSEARKKSNTSTVNNRLTRTTSKMDESDDGYPVQKSYIKVAPNNCRSKTKSILHNSKASKSTIHTLESKKSREDNIHQKEDNKGSKIQEHNQHLKKNIGKKQKGSSFNNSNEDILADLSTHDNNQSHNEKNLQTVSLGEIQKREQKSEILLDHLGSQVKEGSEKVSSAGLGGSKTSHLGHHQTFTTTKKNKISEVSTEVLDNQKRNNVSHMNSMVKDNRKRGNAEVTKGSNEVTEQRKRAIGNEPQRSSFIENLRTSEVRGFQGNSRDYQHNTNIDNRTSNANNKHQRFNNIVHLREIPSNNKQQSLNRTSRTSTEHSFKKKSLSGEKFTPDDAQHCRKSAANNKSSVRNTEQTRTTHDLEKKSSTSIPSKKDSSPPSQKRHLLNHKRSTKDHSEPINTTESIPGKENDKKENSNNLPQSTADSMDNHQSSQYIRRPTDLPQSTADSMDSHQPSQYIRRPTDLPQSTADSMDSHQPSQYIRRPTEPERRLSESPGTSNHSLSLWGYDITPLVHVFQVAQFFLGLTMHDKLMEVVNHYYKN